MESYILAFFLLRMLRIMNSGFSGIFDDVFLHFYPFISLIRIELCIIVSSEKCASASVTASVVLERASAHLLLAKVTLFFEEFIA